MSDSKWSMTAMDRLVWIDTETFGLDPNQHPIIEIGVVTDLELKQVDVASSLVWSDMHDTLLSRMHERKTDTYVHDMHAKSGLWGDAKRVGVEPHHAEAHILEFLTHYGIGKEDPMCGSSIQFDRGMLDAQMSNVAQLFSYRNVDISSIKELCRRLNPKMYKWLDGDTKPKTEHRVIPDLADTIAEARWYFDNFLYIPTTPNEITS